MGKKSRYTRENVRWESSRRKRSGRREDIPPFDEVLARRIGRICRWNRSLVVGAFLTVVFLVLWAYGWSRVRSRVLADEAYQFAAERVELDPAPPAWIRTDIRGETLRDAGLDQTTSLFDGGLTEQLASAFSMHPWVAEVRRVKKEYPGRVVVELEYREPACMVEVEGGLLPVDRNGTVLPTDQFEPEDTKQFPRLSGVDTIPLGPVGTRWGDIRVTEGAQIAAAFSEVWNKMLLHRIEPEKKDPHTHRYSYRLVTRAGTQIHLGPVDESSGGHAALQAKATWLEQYFEQRGTLEGAFGTQEIDLQRVPGAE